MRRAGAYVPVGFLDDATSLKGAKIQGVPVLGVIADLVDVAKDWDVDLIVIAIPSASRQQMQKVVELCEASGLPFQTLPRLQDWVSGTSSLQGLREVPHLSKQGVVDKEVKERAKAQAARRRETLTAEKRLRKEEA